MQKYNDRMLFAIITTLFLGDMLFLGYILHELYNWDTTIIAGVIGFVGAVLGGAITYYGVNKTLRHRNIELFLETATEKLLLVDELIQNFKANRDNAFFYEHSKGFMDHDERNARIKELLEEFQGSLISRNPDIYKSMDYDEVQIIMFHQKSIAALITKQKFGDKESAIAIDNIKQVCNEFNIAKEKLQKKYYRYKKETEDII
ncbi:hypothetical protein NiCM35_18205 [Niallia circulans]|uniref:hypothetical protein n=1 Tax=Niallia circulans TaxID=1397 RepID=UPI003D9694C3